MNDEDLYPVSRVFFETEVEPYLKNNAVLTAKAANRDHYKLFCGMIYILENEGSNADLSKEYDCAWHELYIGFIESLHSLYGDKELGSKAG